MPTTGGAVAAVRVSQGTSTDSDHPPSAAPESGLMRQPIRRYSRRSAGAPLT